MSKNRVEELESTVAELESTVEGLTEELVESKERIRVLEAELDTESPTRAASVRTSESAEELLEADSDVAEEGQEDIESESDDELEEPIEDEAQDSGTDDIIVA